LNLLCLITIYQAYQKRYSMALALHLIYGLVKTRTYCLREKARGLIFRHSTLPKVSQPIPQHKHANSGHPQDLDEFGYPLSL
jgi:hypothetical protein